MSQAERGLRFFAPGSPGGPSQRGLVRGRELDVAFWAHCPCAQKATSSCSQPGAQLETGQICCGVGVLKSTLLAFVCHTATHDTFIAPSSFKGIGPPHLVTVMLSRQNKSRFSLRRRESARKRSPGRERPLGCLPSSVATTRRVINLVSLAPRTLNAHTPLRWITHTLA